MFSQLQFFEIYIKAGEENALEKAVFVRQGFSIALLVFGMFAAVYYRVWWVALWLFAFAVGAEILLLLDWVTLQQELVASIVVAFFVAFQFHMWHGQALEERGYTLLDVVAARNEEEAKRRCFDRYLRTTTSRAVSVAA